MKTCIGENIETLRAIEETPDQIAMCLTYFSASITQQMYISFIFISFFLLYFSPFFNIHVDTSYACKYFNRNNTLISDDVHRGTHTAHAFF